MSFVFWAISQYPKVRATLFPRESLRVWACNNIDGGVIANGGDRELFVPYLDLFMTGREEWTGQRFPVDDSIAPGRFLRIPAPKHPDLGDAFWVKGLGKDEFDGFVGRSLSDKVCFEIVLFVPGDPLLRELLDITGKTLNTMEAGGQIEYHAISSGASKDVFFPAVGAVLAKSSPECIAKVPRPKN